MALIVASGQPQILGLVFFYVHAPAVSMCEIRLLLAIAAFRDMELYQMDTITAFISAVVKLAEIIYYNPPRGIELGLGF